VALAAIYPFLHLSFLFIALVVTAAATAAAAAAAAVIINCSLDCTGSELHWNHTRNRSRKPQRDGANYRKSIPISTSFQHEPYKGSFIYSFSKQIKLRSKIVSISNNNNNNNDNDKGTQERKKT